MERDPHDYFGLPMGLTLKDTFVRQLHCHLPLNYEVHLVLQLHSRGLVSANPLLLKMVFQWLTGAGCPSLHSAHQRLQ